MGALLSLPLMAVPSVGTVCCCLSPLQRLDTDRAAHHRRDLLLWSCDLLSRLQRLWEVPEQVR